MNNETYLDFCFIRGEAGGFAGEIDGILQEVFKGKRLNWYLEEKMADGVEIVVAEVKGMSNWHSENETLGYLEENAGVQFWQYLQGYQMYIYPAKGCGTRGSL
ncbi:hypothetical protein [Bacillus sp. CECT 9360]|uniref:hypothetical protein n=1 Tax=Bacillus sp. CECT 9360 TaxID=2845821 RepID=UPI001E4E6B1B|nr:hypothetical protein [Bacillus sp. CECT 9360]CAH0345267.1 hypothetical protein BCI9360_01548 [Bacillus sp. CECT 9360]